MRSAWALALFASACSNNFSRLGIFGISNSSSERLSLSKADFLRMSAEPSSFLMEMCIHVCGLTHSILVIVPLKFTGLLASNSAANA